MKEQHIVTTYDEDLDKLKSDLFEMALNVEKQIFDSVNLTQILDIKKANQIIKILFNRLNFSVRNYGFG